MQLFDVYPLFDLEITRGEGAHIWDNRGKQYLDFYGGHAVISIGHNHPHFQESLRDQLEKLSFYSNSVKNRLQEKVAKKLAQVSELEDYQLFMVNSGAEAVENALKLASFQTNHTKVIAFKGAFHGRTSAAVNVTDNRMIQSPINTTFETVFLPLGDIAAIQQELTKGGVAAVIIEGIQGIGGIHCHKPQFLADLAELCQQHEVTLILDEIQSGFGRSGRFFAFQYADIQPDIICMAKGMGNGFPVGGILIHKHIKPFLGMLGSTFGGAPLACRAVLSVLNIIQKEQLIANAQQIGEYLKNELVNTPGLIDIRGQGLMLGLEFNFRIKDLRNKLIFEENIFTGSSSNPNVLRLLPPLGITQKQALTLVQKLKLSR